MEQNTYNLISAVISVFTLFVTMIGLIGLYIQIQKLRAGTWSNTHSKLTEQSFELLKFFSSHPVTYDYFYNKKVLTEAAPEKIIILYATEALANFIEHLVLQKENLPKKQWEVWERFIYTTFKSSIITRNFVQDHREWYSLELLEIADKCRVLYD